MSQEHRVLIIDDEYNHAHDVAVSLEAYCKPTIASTPSQVMTEIQHAAQDYALVISDFYFEDWREDPNLPDNIKSPRTAEEIIVKLRSYNASIPDVYLYTLYPEDGVVKRVAAKYGVPVARLGEIGDARFRNAVVKLIERWKPPIPVQV